MRNMTIRRVVFWVMSVLGLMSLTVISFYAAEVFSHLRHAKVISLNNNLANASLRLASVTAMERGLTGVLHNAAQDSDAALGDELSALRVQGEQLYRTLLEDAEQLQTLAGAEAVSAAVASLREHYALMVSTRERVDAQMRNEPGAGSNGECIEVATAYIGAMTQLRQAAARLAENQAKHGYSSDLLLKEVLFTVSEYAGRERATLGAVIAERRPIAMDEYHNLLAYRSVVNEGLTKILTAAGRIDDAEVRQAVKGIEAEFLGRFERLRTAVYQASAQGQAYPLNAVAWYNEATTGIDAILDLSDVLNRLGNDGVQREERDEVVVVVVLAIGLVITLAVFFAMGLIVHYRVLSPLEHLEESALHIAGGNLTIPVQAQHVDEIGALAQSFEIMRKKLLHDGTERELAHDEMRKLMRVVDQTADLVAITDRAGIIEYVNKAFEDTTGYQGEHVVGRHIGFLRSGEQDKAFYVRMWNTLEQGEPFHARFINRCKDGSYYYEEKTISPLRNEDGEITHYVSTGKDVSDSVQVEQQLMQSEKLASIGQLAAGVAHEINNPVGYINSNLGSLKDYFRDFSAMLDAYQQEASGLDEAARGRIQALRQSLDIDFLKEDISSLLAESQEGVSRVKQIVQDLKDFSRIDSSEWAMADLHHGLDSTLNIVNNEIKYKAEVIKEYGKLPAVECVPSQLNQVFMNLLVNAAHAIEERGTITVRTGSRDDEEVWIEVEDTGTGISEQNLKKLFEPFFTTKPVGKGTGLGLSLTYGIVQKHGGKIEVDSELGKGTVFRVTLPVRQPEPQAEAAEA